MKIAASHRNGDVAFRREAGEPVFPTAGEHVAELAYGIAERVALGVDLNAAEHRAGDGGGGVAAEVDLAVAGDDAFEPNVGGVRAVDAVFLAKRAGTGGNLHAQHGAEDLFHCLVHPQKVVVTEEFRGRDGGFGSHHLCSSTAVLPRLSGEQRDDFELHLFG
jgi:hypothetical protein